MAERVCGNCRWFDARATGYGCCRRRSPIVIGEECFPSTHATDRCGEWSDASITPEQEEMQELTRRFALELINSGYDARQTWQVAAEFAAAESRVLRENSR